MQRQVRCRLPPPPRTLSNLGISRFAPKGPELAGCAVGAVVSAETNSGVEGISAELSLALKSGCPATGDRCQAETGSNERDYALRPSIRCWRDHSAGRSLSRTTPIPCGSRPSMAALTRSGARKARRRGDRHVDLPHSATFTFCDAFGIRSRIGDEFIEPSAPPRNRCDQECAVLGTDRTDVLRASDSGTRISRRRVDGVLRHGTSISWRLFRFRFDPTPIASVSSMTSWSDWTSTRVT